MGTVALAISGQAAAYTLLSYTKQHATENWGIAVYIPVFFGPDHLLGFVVGVPKGEHAKSKAAFKWGSCQYYSTIIDNVIRRGSTSLLLCKNQE